MFSIKIEIQSSLFHQFRNREKGEMDDFKRSSDGKYLVR